MREIKFRAWNKDFYMERIPVYSAFLDTFFGNPIYELEQYTGLKDRNGKEIYEGDILLFPRIDEYEPIRRYHEDYYRATIWIDEGYWNLIYESLDEAEIIGNIHENGDLIK